MPLVKKGQFRNSSPANLQPRR